MKTEARSTQSVTPQQDPSRAWHQTCRFRGSLEGLPDSELLTAPGWPGLGGAAVSGHPSIHMPAPGFT